MLKAERLTKIYRVGTFGGKELRAVNNISFDVKDGECVSLIGESGSGKTTIGKMVLRLVAITSGTISLDSVYITSLQGEALKDYYRRVQGVFQDPFSSLNPIFKADRIFQIVHEQFFPHLNDQTWQAKVEKTLWDVGLNPEHVLNKYPHQLSGGQVQRFLIARALLLDIHFLVADEIISMLDASTRIDVLNLLAGLKQRGLSILFITHDLSLANYISERAVILYRGCITEMGVTEKIFEHPRHPYTQMLVTSVPRLDKKWEKQTSVETSASQINHFVGCPYYERCPFAYEKCKQQPEPVEIEPDYFVACWRVSDKP